MPGISMPKPIERIVCCSSRKCEELMGEVRDVLYLARDDSHPAVGDARRNISEHNGDDTAIVQNVGAPFAALQWREEDSINLCRYDLVCVTVRCRQRLCC